MVRKLLAILLVILLMPVTVASADDAMKVVIDYDNKQFIVYDSDNEVFIPEEGQELSLVVKDEQDELELVADLSSSEFSQIIAELLSSYQNLGLEVEDYINYDGLFLAVLEYDEVEGDYVCIDLYPVNDFSILDADSIFSFDVGSDVEIIKSLNVDGNAIGYTYTLSSIAEPGFSKHFVYDSFTSKVYVSDKAFKNFTALKNTAELSIEYVDTNEVVQTKVIEDSFVVDQDLLKEEYPQVELKQDNDYIYIKADETYLDDVVAVNIYPVKFLNERYVEVGDIALTKGVGAYDLNTLTHLYQSERSMFVVEDGTIKIDKSLLVINDNDYDFLEIDIFTSNYVVCQLYFNLESTPLPSAPEAEVEPEETPLYLPPRTDAR